MSDALTRGVATLLVSGVAYTLQYTIAAVCDVEELTTKPISVVGAEMARGFVRARRVVLWGALREHHPQITLKDAGEFLRHVPREEVEDKLAAVLDAAFPKREVAKPGDSPPVTGDGLGANTSPPGAGSPI